MVGFEKNRLVGVSEKEIKEYSCGICREVIKNPKMTTCCRNLFCHECISHGISVNNNCPICRQSASSSSLSLASLLVSNHINEFRIQCNFKDKGCDSVVRVEELLSHEIQCNFNPNKECTECRFVGHKEHNCLTVLKDRNRGFEEENKKFRNSDPNVLQKMVFDSAKNALRSGEVIGWEIDPEDSDLPEPETRELIIEIVQNKLEQSVDCSQLAEDIRQALDVIIDENQYWSLSWYMNTESNQTSIITYTYCLVLRIGLMRIDIYLFPNPEDIDE